MSGWTVGIPETHCGTSKLCEVEYKNPYGYRLTTEARYNAIDKEWREWPSGDVVKVLSYKELS